jgi:hypothetical protein
MGALKNFMHEITDFVLANRSLAENNPISLVGRGCEPLDSMYYHIPTEVYKDMVRGILDKNE